MLPDKCVGRAGSIPAAWERAMFRAVLRETACSLVSGRALQSRCPQAPALPAKVHQGAEGRSPTSWVPASDLRLGLEQGSAGSARGAGSQEGGQEARFTSCITWTKHFTSPGLAPLC